TCPKPAAMDWVTNCCKNWGTAIVEPLPSLVPLVMQQGHWLTTLSGLSLPVALTVAQGTGKVIARLEGSMLCTHFGISGPVVLDVSRHWVAAHVHDREVTLRCALLPHVNFEQLENQLIHLTARNPQRTLVNVLREWLPSRLAEALPRHELGLQPSLVMGQLPRDARRKLVHSLTDLVLPVERDRGWLFAEVTAGGVPLSEVDWRTMQSKVQPGLYLCGEVLDVDGRMGGYNFQWAWCSGRLAGLAAVKRDHG
ncbi:MAG: aminoacetone oxidase family FAD-binding enzyme, partial [Phycisphaerales bacterium]|nr:aminoacetone oxidase family FAD-binding enzyme [Phycisphaerales bacterium]